MKPSKTCKVFEELVRKCSEIPNRGNPKLIYYTTKVCYKTNLAEEIQRDKSRDSSARGNTYILEEQSSKEENEGMYNGRGLGFKGSAVCQRSLAGFDEVLRLRRVFEGFKESLKHLERHQGGSKEIEGFKGGFESFKGVSHDRIGCSR